MKKTNRIEEFMIDSGFKKYNKTSYLFVKNDMLFTVSSQGLKNDLYAWYAIYPLALPEIWVSMGWSNAVGRFPKKVNTIKLDEAYRNKAQEQIIGEIKKHIFPIISDCENLKDLYNLYECGNYRSRYPQAFCLLAMKQYKEGQWALHELTEDFKKHSWGLPETSHIWRYLKLHNYSDINMALEDERVKNIKKHKLVRYIKSL